VAGVLAVDTWLAQNDSRQFRVRSSIEEPGKFDYIPVDHGHSIGSPGWTAAELNARSDPALASTPVPVTAEHVEPAIRRLRQLTSDDAAAIVSQIPPEQIVGDERAALEGYLFDHRPEHRPGSLGSLLAASVATPEQANSEDACLCHVNRMS